MCVTPFLQPPNRKLERGRVYICVNYNGLTERPLQALLGGVWLGITADRTFGGALKREPGEAPNLPDPMADEEGELLKKFLALKA